MVRLSARDVLRAIVTICPDQSYYAGVQPAQANRLVFIVFSIVCPSKHWVVKYFVAVSEIDAKLACMFSALAAELNN